MSSYEFCHSLITFCKLFAYRFNTSFTNFKCTLHFKNIHWDITFLMLDYGKSLSNATNTGVIHDSHTTTNIIRPWYHQVEKWNSFWQISRIKYLLTKCLNDSTLICLSNLNLFLHYSISYCCKRLIWFYWFNWTWFK